MERRQFRLAGTNERTINKESLRTQKFITWKYHPDAHRNEMYQTGIKTDHQKYQSKRI